MADYLNKIILILFLVSISSCITNIESSPRVYNYNEPFFDSYFATFQDSTPVSKTASFDPKWITLENNSLGNLAQITNLKVTLIPTDDIPGRPAWLGTITGILEGENHETLSHAGEIGLRFEVILRNKDNGETGSWITGFESISCESPKKQFNYQHRFQFNIIEESDNALVDISIVPWGKCPR